MKKAGDFFKKKIDLVIVLGDRFEMLAISLLCFLKKYQFAIFMEVKKHWEL